MNTLDVGVAGLGQLPDAGPFHVVVRGGTDTHPEGTYGTPDTVARLIVLAQEYFKVTDRRLSINDLSLPRGGLFDINNNWAPPHHEHRAGADADLNRADEGGIQVDCQVDSDLKSAIDNANHLIPPVELKCETGGKKHVNFD